MIHEGKIGWTRKKAAAKWHEAGGPKLTSFAPKVGSKTCHMDHVVELQMGGTNTRENVQVHDGGPNVKSGTAVRKQIVDLAKAAWTSLPKPKPNYILLHFDDVDWES